MTSLTEQAHIDRLDAALDAGLVCRRAWAHTSAGVRRACLLATLAPECGEAQSASACPADVMPAWMAHLVPRIDDCGTAAEWPRLMRRFAAALRHCATLDDEGWRRLDYRCRAVALREVPAPAAGHRAAVESALSLFDREGRGDAVTGDEWKVAKADVSTALAGSHETLIALLGETLATDATPENSARAAAAAMDAAMLFSADPEVDADRIISGICREMEVAT